MEEKFEPEPLSEKERISQIVDILESGYYSLAVTLTTGDVLFGDQARELGLQYLPYSKKYQKPEYKKKLEMFKQPISDEILLLFPDGSGTVHGHSYAVWIPVSQITHIQGIVPFIKEGPESALRNSPNPLSTSIKEHNLKIVKKVGLKQRDYREMALSEKAISKGGIKFDKFELIYVDWEYFKEKSGGIRSIGASAFVGASVAWEKSLHKSAMEKLQKVKHTNPPFEGYNGPKEVKVKGIIREDPEKQDTDLGKSTWSVYELSTFEEYESVPVLIREIGLCYPKEYLNHIESELTVFGELKQIPIHLNEQNYDLCLIARVIAYVHSD